MATQAIPKSSVVYVRYKDHVLYRNELQPVRDAAECETVGWLTKEDNEIIAIEHDRAIGDYNYTGSRTSGLVLLKSCVLEIRALPLQTVPRGSLSCPENKPTDAEYALQKPKRKTQPK